MEPDQNVITCPLKPSLKSLGQQLNSSIFFFHVCAARKHLNAVMYCGDVVNVYTSKWLKNQQAYEKINYQVNVSGQEFGIRTFD